MKIFQSLNTRKYTCIDPNVLATQALVDGQQVFYFPFCRQVF